MYSSGSQLNKKYCGGICSCLYIGKLVFRPLSRKLEDIISLITTVVVVVNAVIHLVYLCWFGLIFLLTWSY